MLEVNGLLEMIVGRFIDEGSLDVLTIDGMNDAVLCIYVDKDYVNNTRDLEKVTISAFNGEGYITSLSEENEKFFSLLKEHFNTEILVHVADSIYSADEMDCHNGIVDILDDMFDPCTNDLEDNLEGCF